MMLRKVLEKVVQSWTQMRTDPSAPPFPDDIRQTVLSQWREMTPVGEAHRVVAVDGGMFLKESRAGVIYAIDAESLLYESSPTILLEEADVGVLRPGINGKDVVGGLMSLMELRLANLSLPQADVILMDGSLKAKLRLVKMEALKDMRDPLLRSIESLLKEGKVLWVSKRSRSAYLGASYPDHYIFECLAPGRGASVPMRSRVKSPMQLGLMESFMRLEIGGPMLKVEWSGNFTEEDVFRMLSSVPLINGYPYPLLKVHFDVRFGAEDRETIISTLGLKVDKVADWWPSQFY